MFYASLYINDETGENSLVIIEKDLKSARKIYRVCHVEKLIYEGNEKPPVDYLKATREKDAFITRKKVFSQSKRPPKITRTPPLFLMAEKANNGDGLTSLRNADFSVEGLIFEENSKWHKEELSPLRYGCNYHVNPEDISKALKKVCKGERLFFDSEEGLNAELSDDLKVFQKEGTASDLLSALSLAVWFCERVKQVKRY